MHLRSTHAFQDAATLALVCFCLHVYIWPCMHASCSSRDIPYVDEEKMGKGQLCGEDAQSVSHSASAELACAWKLALRLCVLVRRVPIQSATYAGMVTT